MRDRGRWCSLTSELMAPSASACWSERHPAVSRSTKHCCTVARTIFLSEAWARAAWVRITAKRGSGPSVMRRLFSSSPESTSRTSSGRRTASASSASSTSCFAEEETMSTEHPLEKVIAAYGQAWNSHDIEAILAMHTEDSVFENHTSGGQGIGKDAIREILRGVFATF